MSDRGATPIIVGLLTGFVDVGLEVAYFANATVLTRASFRVTDAPSGGTVTAELNTASDGSGSSITATIADGARFATATGSVSITAASTLYLIVTAESGSALNLSGEYEVESASGVSAALTSLTLVKQELQITTTDAARDLLLANIITGVSRKMQDWMDRKIVQLTATDEKIDSLGSHLITTNHYPIISITSLVEDGTALVEDTGFEIEEYDKEVGQIARISSGDPAAWVRGLRVVKITYVHGFASVPDSLSRAATAQVCMDYFQTQESGKAWRGLSSKSVDPASSVALDLDFWERSTVSAMSPYRRWIA